MMNKWNQKVMDNLDKELLEDYKERIKWAKQSEWWHTEWRLNTDDLKIVGSDLINIPEMGIAPIVDSFVHQCISWEWIRAEDWNQDKEEVYASSENITVYCVLGLDGELYFAWQYPKADYCYPWFMVNSELM